MEEGSVKKGRVDVGRSEELGRTEKDWKDLV